MVYGFFVFNYFVLISCGIFVFVFLGLKYVILKFVLEVVNQFFIDNCYENLINFFDYDELEFIGSWLKDNN